MSATTQTPDPAAANGLDDIEARARILGWRPKEEYRGPPEGWRDAAEFVERGETDLRLMRENNRALVRRQQELTIRVAEGQAVIQDLSERFRTADERAYKRARADLMREQEAAVEAGDTVKFRQTQTDLAELDATKPKPPPVVTPPAPAQPAPEAVAWGERNPWFRTDDMLRAEATRLHLQLQSTEPELSISQNLDRVTQTLKTLYPSRFPGARAAAAPSESADDDNPRRNQPASVSSASAPGGPSRATKNSFAAMPKDSKDAFIKYKKALEGKGKPLTEGEWADRYWSQFEET